MSQVSSCVELRVVQFRAMARLAAAALLAAAGLVALLSVLYLGALREDEPVPAREALFRAAGRGLSVGNTAVGNGSSFLLVFTRI